MAEQVIGQKYLTMLDSHLLRLRKSYDHSNRRLHYDQLLCAWLLALFNPAIRSLRCLEDLSQIPRFQEQLDLEAICRNTASSATHLFDPALLEPIIAELRARLPEPLLRQQDPQLAQILKAVVAADGSYFTIASHVAWALHHHRSDGQVQGQIRLNWQLRILDGMPGPCSVSGAEQGKEAAAMAQLLEGGLIYVVDRHYVDFAFLKAVLGANSEFVLRARSNAPSFVPQEDRPLSEQDLAAGVIRDRVGTLPGGRWSPAAPRQLVREVVILNEQTKETVRLLTSLLEVEAAVIGLIYRYRWQVELFFRWLKVLAHFEHLWAHSRNGLTIQFYVAVIGVLLMYVRTGQRLSKYGYAMMTLVASGQATLEQIVPILERRERERELERQRLERKRAQKTT